ncbi:uncharacterized protein AC631_00077 [Debaryomyces fabryi]|uniref:Zn(2)-C6 fungal-type domain-containing protein n=1 Tax=Debaryomyces fabryi TaxID=58627 RepID=A0A0V1Q6R3_9ASCO|nr:uncharacterized protein AC631_00077 [Debaryomyces fabryi]KSA04206.1 hypothetical protein AC631_00077 [Debaryomyces fabryi]CUM46264.1 unnamed protein product [Debaryomyces fabryi]
MVNGLGNPTLKQKQRNRVPVSCLICKRRKVKCDKVKPACGGCIKNGVPHLCEYVEPAWTNNAKATNPQVNNNKSNDQIGQPEKTKKQIQKDKLINEQRKEIEELKRQLSVSQQLHPKAQRNDNQELRVSILEKLNVNNLSSKSTIDISNDKSYTVKRQVQKSKSTYIDTYSWVSIIKLDPHLTTLWYKITNLQKIYHLYKMNLLNSQTKNDVLDNTSSTTNAVSKKSSYKINEIDFTHSLVPGPKAPNSYLKCPVVECDFNFMFEASPTLISTTTPGSTTKSDVTESPDKGCPYHKDLEHMSAIDRHNELSGDSKIFLKKIQNIWNSTLMLLRGNETMNYFQMNFLIDYYFNESKFTTESRNLLSFYREEIQSIIKKNGDTFSLNFAHDQSRSDEDRYFNLILKGLYLCMLSLIVEESLEIIRLEADIGDFNSVSPEFRSLFPSEVLYLGLGYKANNILLIVQEYLLHVSNDVIFKDKMSDSLIYILCCTTFLNREVVNYKRQNTDSNSKFRFQTIFIQLLSNIFGKRGYLEVWKNPQEISLRCNESEQKLREFRLSMCYLWSDLVRLVNLATFSLSHLISHPEKITDLVLKFYDKVEGCDRHKNHIIYIGDHGSVQDKKLVSTLSINYLISKIYCNLRYGIVSFGEVRLTTSMLYKMIENCTSWKADDNLYNNTRIRSLETRCILHYSSLHLSYIIFLQEEEKGHKSNLNKLYCDFFIQFCEFILFVEVIIKNEPGNSGSQHSQHLLLLVTELLTRTIHFIIGLLLRLGNIDELNSASMLPKKLLSIFDSKLLGGTMETDDEDEVYKALHNRLVNVINQEIISLLDSYITGKEKAIKLSKLWNFYLTFIKNSHKMSSLDYATIHSNIPLFKNMKSQNMALCPVVPGQSNTDRSQKCPVKHEIATTGNKSGDSKCPISHITTPMNEDANPITTAPDKCPIDHKSLIDSQHSKKRKFPLDHPSPQIGGILPNGYNTVESNIRSSTQKLKCPVRGSPKENYLPVSNLSNPSSLGFDPISTNNVIPDNMPNPMNAVDNVMVPGLLKSEDSNMEIPSFGVNWQEFNDFDFEFLQNELMFKQVQDLQDNNFSNPSIEDLFR